MRLISRSEVERLLPVSACVALMRQAMMATSQRQVELPIRQFLPIPDVPGKLAIMPGALRDPACFGIKLVCKYDRPQDDPLGTHVGMVILFDSAKGIPLAMIEGSSLTAIRTSATSALATDVLARADAKHLAIIGAGEQAARHIHAMRAVRPIESVAIWGRDPARAAAFAAKMGAETGLHVAAAATVEVAVSGADIICTTTSAKEPVLAGAWLEPGMHINLVGSAIATTAEIDSEAVQRSRFYVDYRDAALAAAGELLKAIESKIVTKDHIIGEIGEVLLGRAAGRQTPGDITLYKSLGLASQDLAAAYAVWQLANLQDTGQQFDLQD
jgi:ornithine cyclodeaminase/alanine dehydrogenase-like protein (mu-crystallin family)